MSAQILAQAAGEFTRTSTGEAATFWVLAPVAVLAALGMVLARNAVHGALLLVTNLFCLAVFYMLQDAPFLGFVQIVVYTGAIMVLFLFVLMLVGVDSSDSLVETLRGQRVAAIVLGVGFAGLLVFPIGGVIDNGTTAAGLAAANDGGNIQAIARLLFTDYVFAFEIISALLIIAAVGAMILGHRERVDGKVTQREMLRRRFAEGGRVTPVPGPAVYARPEGTRLPAGLPGGGTDPGAGQGARDVGGDIGGNGDGGNGAETHARGNPRPVRAGKGTDR
ncbi:MULTISPECIES: NADH-quinone oxidoreductase subunit J [Protofrankia]|uniref:NADH-quinone oxidoreductase subunit J n=1 Tax=Candidatus Protofrankia datiscae TaxID=2716812 RepID=F8AVG9_9ACTN|nr:MULTISPECIES: NADH-quinone oxidoreductase subunit J [Protofrankia]AEH11273.1 NADH-ubiquinone/plastoquinone oxidoreductase chain 6 [Candidatus Protofrankia datiscae]